MRFIDFMVFYTMANFNKKGMDGLIWGSKLARAAFLASLNLTLPIFIFLEVCLSLFFKLDVFDSLYFKIGFVLIAIFNATILDYIYINRRRYEYITSQNYQPFNLSLNVGIGLCLLIFLISVLGVIIIGVFVTPYLMHVDV